MSFEMTRGTSQNGLTYVLNKPGIREKASNEDTDTEFLFALLKHKGVNRKCGNMDLL